MSFDSEPVPGMKTQADHKFRVFPKEIPLGNEILGMKFCKDASNIDPNQVHNTQNNFSFGYSLSSHCVTIQWNFSLFHIQTSFIFIESWNESQQFVHHVIVEHLIQQQ